MAKFPPPRESYDAASRVKSTARERQEEMRWIVQEARLRATTLTAKTKELTEAIEQAVRTLAKPPGDGDGKG